MPLKSSATERPTVVVPINAYSDGNPKKRPTGRNYTCIDPLFWLQKVATQWMNDKGEVVPGTNYQLDQLPSGYALYDRPRLNNPSHRDRYLYGHPLGKEFTSPKQFYQHFKFLMEHKNDDTCICDLCKLRPSGQASSSGGRPPLDNGRKGGQDPRDIYAILFDLLKAEGVINQAIEEPWSFDWQCEAPLMEPTRRKATGQYSFIPRVGELVLFCKTVDGVIQLETSSGEFKMFDPITEKYGRHPVWMAGMISEDPEEPVCLGDIREETEKKFAVTGSGFRVHCLPNVNDLDKGLGKQYAYVPMHHIRPFCFFGEVLAGIPTSDWHPSIDNARCVMASLSVSSRHHIKGTWPNAAVYCKSMFLGSERLFVGDAARIVPASDDRSLTEVFLITNIKVSWENLQPEKDGRVTGNKADRLSIFVHGKHLTLDPNDAYERMPVDEVTLPLAQGMKGHGQWYHMASPELTSQVTYSRLLGRCYEADAMGLWQLDEPGVLDTGLDNTLAARKYSGENDHRIIKGGKKWYWGDYRLEVLDLVEVNGEPTSLAVKPCHPEHWRTVLRDVNGVADKNSELPPVAAGTNKAGRSFLGPHPTTSPRKSAMEISALDEEDETSVGEETAESNEEEEYWSEEEEEISELVTGVVPGENDGHETDGEDHQATSEDELSGPDRKRSKTEL